jgi:hypothetical protein
MKALSWWSYVFTFACQDIIHVSSFKQSILPKSTHEEVSKANFLDSRSEEREMITMRYPDDIIILFGF